MFYENLEKLCYLAGTSPSAVAVEIGLGRSTPSSWKANGTIPKKKDLENLADYLKCDVEDFFKNDIDCFSSIQSGANSINTIQHTETGCKKADDNILEFIRIYERCDPRQRLKLMTAVFDFEDKVLSTEQED